MKGRLILLTAVIFAAVSVYAQNSSLQTALEQVELNLKNAEFNAGEITEIKNHLRIALKDARNVDADAISEAAIECKKHGLTIAQSAKVSAAAARASQEATLQTRTQNRAMIRESLKEGCDAEGVEAALEAVKSAIASGNSPKAARGMVAVTVLEGLKDGLRGKELAAKIHEAHSAFTGKQRAEDRGMTHSREKTMQRTQQQERRQQHMKSGVTTPETMGGHDGGTGAGDGMGDRNPR